MLDKLKMLQYGLKIMSETRQHVRVNELNGRKVQILEGGEGEPVLYFHSAYGENLWLPFHGKLAESFRVVAPAHPGFAQTEGLDDIDSMEDMVFHYLDLTDQLGLKQVSIVGVSLGAWIAAEYATRYPERVKKLVLGCPAGIWLDEYPMTDMFALMRRPEKLRKILFHDPDSFLAKVLVPEDAPEEQLKEAYKSAAATAKLAWNPPGHNPKLYGRLHRIKSPTMIIWGDDDKLIPTPYAQAWSKGIAGSKVQILKDCGHLIMFEGQDQFVDAVTDFLK